MFTQRTAPDADQYGRRKRQANELSADNSEHQSWPAGFGSTAADGRRRSDLLSAAGAAPEAGSSPHWSARRRGRRTARQQRRQELDSSLTMLGSIWAKYEGSSSAAEPDPLPLALPLTLLPPPEQQPQSGLAAHLHIDSLSSEDNGLYSCRVDFRKARSRTQETLLKIIGECASSLKLFNCLTK